MLTFEFENLISRFLIQYGVDILNNPVLCKSLLKDFAKGEFQNEIRLFMLAIEEGLPAAIQTTNDIELTARQAIQKLHSQHFIAEDAAFEITALLVKKLRNYTLVPPTPQPAPQYTRPAPALPPAPRRPQRQNRQQQVHITDEMNAACYEYGRQVYERRITAADAADIIENQYGMNRNSALIYINNFPLLREGRAYNRILSVDATRCFIENFYRDYGNEGLQNALAALEGHINYQINVLGNPAHSLRRLLEEFRRRV